jgi:holin-like protein
MLFSLCVILACQLAGEALMRVGGVPVPGPVLGMAVLFIILLVAPPMHARVQQVAHVLLNTMSLFFIPAGVGAMTVWHALRDNAGAFTAVVVASTLIAGWVAALVFTWTNRRVRGAA